MYYEYASLGLTLYLPFPFSSSLSDAFYHIFSLTHRRCLSHFLASSLSLTQAPFPSLFLSFVLSRSLYSFLFHQMSHFHPNSMRPNDLKCAENSDRQSRVAPHHNSFKAQSVFSSRRVTFRSLKNTHFVSIFFLLR